jgi:HAMP domain-containing protein
VRPNMAFAYRHVALPVAIIAAAIVLVAAFIMEIRQYRRARALDQIERQMIRAS